MDKNILVAVQESDQSEAQSQLCELQESQLAFVGGGMGEATPA